MQISNLGLNMPGQQPAQGFFHSVGASFGFGERHQEKGLDVPGVGTYKIDKGGEDNNQPKYS